jgi:hypothetical protein
MTRSRLIKTLDSEFRTFIRVRDITGAYSKCFVCGMNVQSDTLQVGHFVRRGETGLRWSEKNNHLICGWCNGPEKTNLERYSIAIDNKYGPGTSDFLITEGKKVTKLMLWEIKERIKYYRDLNNEREKIISLLRVS